MSELAIFNFEQLPVRVVMIDGEPWFVASDVCKILEINNVSQALSRLDEDERKLLRNNSIITNDGVINQSLNPNQEVALINESGLYALTLTSRKPEAKRFRKWLTSEVLPKLRKDGRYELPPQNHDQSIVVRLENQLLAMAKQQQAIQWSCDWTANESHQLTAYFWELRKLHSELQFTFEKINLLYHFLHQWLGIDGRKKSTVKTPRKPPYTADSKIAFKETLRRLEKHGKDYQQLADFLNENQTSTLTGEGVWTALKVKRLLNS